LSVFVLPFFLPPTYFQGVSASNLAGFNNKVAALAAASMALVVFFLALKWPQVVGASDEASATGERVSDIQQDRLSRSLVIAVAALWGVAVLVFGVEIIRAEATFPGDWGYFINRVSMHADFGRKLYTQIEFPYGPLLFYGPIAVRAALNPFHLSAAAAYLATLALEIMVGILLLAYVIDHLPMSRRWKALIFLLLAGGMIPFNMGLNYTFFRFVPLMAFLVFASGRRQEWAAALWIFVGQAVCLALSPEIGFAFFLSGVAYASYQCFVSGWGWVMGVVAPILSTAAFLLLTGGPYLRMVGMYAHGVMSLPVEPLPYVLLFLFALVWMVPGTVADFFLQRRSEAPMLAALCLSSLALLPAGFGRADPWHIYWNGLSIFLLSAVSICSRRLWYQIVWGGCLAAMFLWMCNINRHQYYAETHPIFQGTIALLRGRPAHQLKTDGGFDLRRLQTIVRHEPVVLPELVPLSVETSLRDAGQYTPTFFYLQTAVLDSAGEDREIREFNGSKWALIPRGDFRRFDERPEDLKYALGFRLPYPAKRPVYTIGLKFSQNLATNWRIRGGVGDYLVYENVGACHGYDKSYGLTKGT